jgi:quinolinate synthase
MDGKGSIEERINKLKKEKNAIILSHYYQEPAIQELADFVGDSLDLSRQSALTSADIIVATESGILHQMKMINLENIFKSLEEEQFDISINPEVLEKARKPILA